MKIKPEHLAHMKEAIGAALSPEDVAAHRRFIVEEGKAKDVDKRLRWDLTYRTPGMSRWLVDNVYPYADDENLDTALRAVMRDLYPDAAVEPTPTGPSM